METHASRPDTIKSMFSKIAKQYDKTNSVLSVGIHHLWKKQAVQLSGAKLGDSVLDCATGTGDLALLFKKVVGDQGQVIGSDFCQEMLDLAPAKAEAANLEVKFEIADVMSLHYPDNHFDVVSISFGIRNVADTLQGLKELARVTKPGGRVVILEFGQIQTPVIGKLYNYYSNYILPKIGGLLTKETTAYSYLNQSAAAFPSGDKFVALMKETGSFEKISTHPIQLGLAYIYVGEKK